MLFCIASWLWTKFMETLQRIISQQCVSCTNRKPRGMTNWPALTLTRWIVEYLQTTFILERFPFPQWTREINKSKNSMEKFHLV